VTFSFQLQISNHSIRNRLMINFLRASAVNQGFLPNTSFNKAVVCAIGSLRIFLSSSAMT
jgi:hypothetical protein